MFFFFFFFSSRRRHTRWPRDWSSDVCSSDLIYFLMREPLPYACPQCGASVSARFNFCPNCKCNLQPSCPQCKREVAELDKFCPYCGTDLAASAPSERPQVPAPAS